MKIQYPGIEVAFVDLSDWYKSKESRESLDLAPFDGLVNCAGIILNEPFLEARGDSFDK